MLRFVMQERGESEFGVLAIGLILAVVIAVFVTLQGCIKDTKDSRVERAIFHASRGHGEVRGLGPERQPRGYRIKY
jgi:hypothetical protein